VLCIGQDVTEQRRAIEALRQREALLEATLQAIPDLLFEVDQSGRYLDVRARRPELLAAPSEELLGRNVNDVLPPDGARAVMEALRAASDTGMSLGQTFELGTPGGVRWFELSVARKAQAPRGEPTYIVLSRDVTDRKRAERALEQSLAEKSLLLREVHHRVKNNLQVISSLLYLQAESAGDAAVRAPLEESRSRVRAMAVVHEILCESSDLSRVDFDQYLRKVTRGIVAWGDRRGVVLEVAVDARDALLDIQQAVPCGLIVNELVTNALKYAFPDGRPGRIGVSFARDAEGRGVLTVSDDGVGLPAALVPASARTLGLRMVHGLATQLEAVVTIERSEGTRFELVFAA
jgi:PAS domain S-box-containing protein